MPIKIGPAFNGGVICEIKELTIGGGGTGITEKGTDVLISGTETIITQGGGNGAPKQAL